MIKLDTTEIKRVYKTLEENAKGTLQDFVENGDIQSEDKAAMIANVINNITNQSVNSLIIPLQLAINTEKLNQEIRSTPFKLDTLRIQNNTLEQKHFTEQLRNGGVSFTYEFYKSYTKDGHKVETTLCNETTITIQEEVEIINEDKSVSTEMQDVEYILYTDYKRVKSKVINEGTALSTVELSNLKIIEETEYVQTQSQQLVASVIYNNQLKVFDGLTSSFGSAMAGGMNVPTAGWTYAFDIAKDLTSVDYNFTNFVSTKAS